MKKTCLLLICFIACSFAASSQTVILEVEEEELEIDTTTHKPVSTKRNTNSFDVFTSYGMILGSSNPEPWIVLRNR